MTRAAVIRGPEASIEIVDVTLPDLRPTDVLVQLVAAGVCHSDLSMVNGTISPSYPFVLGHEASGVIAQVGGDVDDVRAGDGVVLNWAAPCRGCWYCRNNEPWLCSHVEGVVTRPAGELDGATLHQALGVGAFAERVVRPRSAVVPLPGGVPLDLAALLGCAVLTGTGAVWRTARVRPGESVAVVGLGGIGLSVLAGAQIAGADPIIAIDNVTSKESLAEELGATAFLPSGPHTSKEIRRLTDDRGADHTFECVGTPATIRLAWQSTRRGGQCIVIGIGRRDAEVPFNAMELYHFNRRLMSSIYGSSDPERDLPELGTLVTSGQLDLAALVTHRIGLDGLSDALHRMQTGDGARSLITFEH